MIKWFKKRKEKKKEDKRINLKAQEMRDRINSYGAEEMERINKILDIQDNYEQIYSKKYKKWFRIHHPPGIYYCLRNDMTFQEISTTYVDSFYDEAFLCAFVSTDKYNVDINHVGNLPVNVFEIDGSDWIFKEDYIIELREERIRKILE
jgi:hypothetical protein